MPKYNDFDLDLQTLQADPPWSTSKLSEAGWSVCPNMCSGTGPNSAKQGYCLVNPY